MSKKNDKNKINVIDRRRVSLESGNEETPEYERKHPTYIEQLEKQLSSKDEKLRERLEELKKESEAYKKRLQTEMEKRAESSLMELFASQLEVIDSFDRALETASSEHSFDDLMQGMKLIRNHFLSVLKKAGVTPVKTLNHPFNPDLAEAMGVVETGDAKKDNIVMEEFSKGYKYKEKLLRPAMVRVGKLKKKKLTPPSPPKKKYPCPDCNHCQWCADSRCNLCRGTCSS